MTNHGNCDGKYLELQARIDGYLKDITTGLMVHASGQAAEASWSRVGDLGHYADQLQELADQLCYRGEYSERG